MNYLIEKENNSYKEKEIVDIINEEFDDYQERLRLSNLKLKLITKADASNEFYSLIDDLCGTELSKK